MRPRVPSLENERTVIFGLHEENNLTAFRMLIEGRKWDGISFY
jgi:hypothetical protein